jgi:hypothetical protein
MIVAEYLSDCMGSFVYGTNLHPKKMNMNELGDYMNEWEARGTITVGSSWYSLPNLVRCPGETAYQFPACFVRLSLVGPTTE